MKKTLFQSKTKDKIHENDDISEYDKSPDLSKVKNRNH